MSPPRILRVGEDGSPVSAILEAAAALARGGIVVHPTETLYGLAADPWNGTAMAALAALKERGAEGGFILLIASREESRALIAEDDGERLRILEEEFWPGPLTLILKPGPGAPALAIGPRGGIAVRLTADPVARTLVRAAGRALTSTSANLHGEPPAATGEEAARIFGDRVDLVLDAGPRMGGVPSTIVDLTASPPVIAREGAISRARIESCLARVSMQRRTEGRRA